MSKKNIRALLITCSLIAVFLVAYGRFMWPAPFSVGDWTYPLPTKTLSWQGWPSLFQSGNLSGYLGLMLYGSFITTVFTWLVSVWHFSAVALTSVFYLWMPIALLATGMWQLGRELKWPVGARWLATVIYAINSYVLILIEGGQINGIIAYACIPFVILYLDRLLHRPTVRLALMLNLWLLLISMVEPRYHLLTALIAVWWIIGRWPQYRLTRESWRTLGLTAVVFLLFNLYWIYGTFGVTGTALAPADYTSPNWLAALSYDSAWHALLLHHVWWPQAGHISAPIWIFIVLPIISLFGCFAKQRRMVTAAFGLLLIGVLLAKGVNPPLGEINRWIFLHLPGFSGFRDPAKFFTLIAFAYAILVPLGVIGIWKITAKKLVWTGRAVPIVLLLLMFGLGYQTLWLQQVKGTFDKDPTVADQSTQWFASLPDTADWYRVLWFPKSHRYFTYDPAHPSIETLDDPMRTVRNRLPSLDTWLGKFDDPSYLSYLLSAYGVRYVAVPGDTADDLYQTTFPFSQDAAVTAWQQTNLFDQPATIVDQLGKTTYVAHYAAGLPEGFVARELVVTNSPNHPAFTERVSTDPTQTALVWSDDQASTAANKIIYQHAKNILIQSDFDVAALEEGVLKWPLELPVAEQYRLSLPHSDFTYRLDAQPLIFADQQTINNQSYDRTAPLSLESGPHTLSLDLTSGSAPSLVPTLTANSGWQACKSSEMGHLRGLDDLSNAGALRSQPLTALDNVIKDTRCISYPLPDTIDLTNAQLLVRWQGQVTGTTPYLQLNFAPISGTTVDFTELKTGPKLITAPTIDYDLARISIILPAGEQSALTTDELSIAVVSHGAVPITAAILEPIEASTSSSLPTITTQTINDTKKIVTVEPHNSGIWLTVSNEFHPGWQLREQSNRQLMDGHFSTLLKQNGWYLPASDTTQTFEMQFEPATKVKTANYISLITLIVIIVLVVKQRKKR